MGTPPAVFARAQAKFTRLLQENGLVQTRSAYDEAAFGSAFAEYRGAAGALRLVWDGKDATLFAEVLVDGHWTDVETLASGRPPPVDHDQSDQPISRILDAATGALSRRS